MRLRLHSTLANCQAVARRLTELFEVVGISGPYRDRGRSVLVRVDLELRLDPDPAGLPTQPTRQPPKELP